MPTVGVKRDLLFKALGRTYSKSCLLQTRVTDTSSAWWFNVFFCSERQKNSEFCLNSLAWWLTPQQLLTSGCLYLVMWLKITVLNEDNTFLSWKSVPNPHFPVMSFLLMFTVIRKWS